MKFSVRIVSLVLVCLMLLPMAMSCGKTDDPAGENGESDASTLSPEEIEEIYTITGLEKKNLDGEVFSVRYSRYADSEWCPKPVDPSKNEALADKVSEAAYNRNRRFEELTGAELSFDDSNTNPNDYYGKNSEIVGIRALVSSGDIKDYDMIMVGARPAGTLIMEQTFMDLNEYENLVHYDREYYNNVMNSKLSMGTKQLIATGYYTTGNLRGTQACMANNTLLSAQHVDIDEIYQLALDHKWTFEKLLEYDKGFATGNVNADTTLNRYTFIISEYGSENLYYTFGGELITKDNQDLPTVAADSTKSIEIFSYINEKITGNYQAYIAKESGSGAIFVAGQSLFSMGMIGSFGAGKRSGGFDERLLPCPLYNEGDEYRSFLPTWNANVSGIPAGVEDAEHAAYCYELFMALSYQFIYPQYYEKTFELQYIDHYVETQIFDIVIESTMIDIPQCYGWLDPQDTSVRKIVCGTSTPDAGTEKIAATLKTSVNDFLSKYTF